MTNTITAEPGPYRQCAYCWNRDPRDAWTIEHVIPEAIGGDLIDGTPFELADVCAYCNNRCGQWVDGPYIRSFFTNTQRATVAWQWADLSVTPIVPLLYLGQTTGIVLPDDLVCEAWSGPGGDHVYHLHRPYPREPHEPPMIGRPIHLPIEKFDPGITFLFIAASEPWWQTVLRSVAEKFKDSELYLGNGEAPGHPYSPIPDHRKQLFKTIHHYVWTSPEKNASFEVSPFYAQRFEHKVALGMGALLLARSFLSSADAKHLRDVIFCIDDDKRQKLIAEGTGLLEGTPELEVLLSWIHQRWPGAHTVMVRPSPDGQMLMLALQPYGAKASVRVISRTPDHWYNRIPQTGLIYVTLPGLRRHVGPIPFLDLLGWRNDPDRFPNAVLDQLARYAAGLPPVPSPIR